MAAMATADPNAMNQHHKRKSEKSPTNPKSPFGVKLGENGIGAELINQTDGSIDLGENRCTIL